MSGNLGPQASTKGETTSKTTTKTGYDRLDINKLYKKTTEPVAKTVTQKHGMQTLGKAPPARRAGASVVKSEPTSKEAFNSSVPPSQQQQPHQPPNTNLGQSIPQNPKWSSTSSHPPPAPSPLNAPNAPTTGPAPQEKNWPGGSEVGGSYQSQRFAQEFPSLDAGAEPARGGPTANQQLQSSAGSQGSSKSQDNQYGPGPILRPQTEGSWTQGGGRGSMQRPPGPPGPNANPREQGQERPNLGGPTPPPMSLGQGGPAPPPLGPYPMQYRGMAPFMYPNAGPPRFYPPPGPGMPRYGMQIPPGAPPPSNPRDPNESHRDPNRNRGPQPPMRPTQQFAVKPILKQEDLRRMDDIDQEGTWASVRDDVDYNKRISFSDDENEERKDGSRRAGDRRPEKDRPENDREKKSSRQLDKPPPSSERDPRFDHAENSEHSGYEQDNDDNWSKRRGPNVNYDMKDHGGRRGRDSRDEDWRSSNANANNTGRYEDDRNKKVPQRIDPRGAPDFNNKQFGTNLPPRLMKQQQQQQQHFNVQPVYGGTQRKTPSPVTTTSAGIGKDRDRDSQREREWERSERDRPPPTTQYRILERNRGDSESSTTSMRDKRGVHEYDTRTYEKDHINRVITKETPRDKRESESPKDRSESGDIQLETNRSEESKAAFRSKNSFTSSWADDVEEDDDYSKDYDDTRKSSRDVPAYTAIMKSEAMKAEERSVPKRVYIQQRKVENMTTQKPEKQPEPKPKEPVVRQEKPMERPRPTAWGERDNRDKSNNDSESSPNVAVDNDRERPTETTEREIILSEKAQQLIHMNKEDNIVEKGDRKSQETDRTVKEFEKKDKDRLERHDSEKGRDRYNNHKSDSRQVQERDRGTNYNRDRPRSGRWGSNDYRKDNRTPERENVNSTGRSNSSEAESTSSVSTSNKLTDSEISRTGTIEKRRSIDNSKDTQFTNEKDVESHGKDLLERERIKEQERQRDKEFDKRPKNANEFDSERGNYKNVRGRERVGHGVYQPRGSWGRPDNRGRGRGGRDHFDKPRRHDMDREGRHREERDYDQSKDKEPDKEFGSGMDDHKKSSGPQEDERENKERDTGSGEPRKMSPVTNKRNIRGGNRLQGYGPPSDKNPFSAASSSKDEDSNEDKHQEHVKAHPTTQTGPVPLMELGDISPPSNMPPKFRNLGGRGRGGSSSGMPPRMQESFSFRGGPKRGRGDAKPLMSITSNELERQEWESGSESGEDGSKKGQVGGSKSKKEKEVSKAQSGGDKFRQNQSISRNSPKDKAKVGAVEQTNFAANNQDTANNNKGKGSFAGRSGTSNSDLDSYSSVIPGDGSQAGNTSDNSENIDGDGYQSAQGKKGTSKEQTNFSTNKNLRNDKVVNKERKIKNPPYEARPNPAKDIPPRFQKPSQDSNSNSSVTAWDKPNVNNSKSDQTNSGSVLNQSGTASTSDAKELTDIKSLSSVLTNAHNTSTATSAPLESSAGPVKTMIFENRNFKSLTNPKTSSVIKTSDMKKDSITASLDLSKDILNFGKGIGGESPELDFVSSFEETTQSQGQQSISSHSATKPMPIGQPPRSYASHQPSPISPLAADLNEKIQSVKRVWDPPTMPSVAEQTSVCGTEDNSFHGSFGNDSFKSAESATREFGSLQQPTSGYAPGSSPALSAISKPESSTSPNASNLRQVKPPQQPGMENQNLTGMTSSPFAYSMPQQQHQTNAFGGMPAVPSPPSVMYGASPSLHTGVYQAFPHVDASQVLSNSGRSQYAQFPNPQSAAGGTPFGLGVFMTSMDGYQPLSSYQHQPQHSQNAPGQGQAPNQNNRISPGPVPTSSGGSGGAIMMNSQNMKPISSGHPNIQHQHQVMSGTHSQQNYSQLSHHHPGHHQHSVGPVGPSKPATHNYTQGGPQPQSHVYIPYDPNQQSVINLGQSYLTSGIRNAPPGGPPPSATPPVQNIQGSSAYYSGNSSNQVYHTGSNQGGNLQQLHVAVTPNPQALQNLQTATQQFGMQQFQSPLSIQGYNQHQQATTTVSALNLGGPLMRQGPPGHSYIKQHDMVQQQQQMKSHDSMMNPGWNTQAFSMNQNFHGGNKPTNSDRNPGNNMGIQRKNSHPMGNMPNMGLKYMQNTPGYPVQKAGRFSGPGPIQRPVSTSPSTGSIGPQQMSGVSSHVGPMGIGSGNMGGMKQKHMTNESTNKHINQSHSGMEEGLLDKLMIEASHRSLSGTPDPTKIMPSSRLVEDHSKELNGSQNAALKHANQPISSASKTPISSSEK